MLGLSSFKVSNFNKKWDVKARGFENKTNTSQFEAFSYLLLSLAGWAEKVQTLGDLQSADLTPEDKARIKQLMCDDDVAGGEVAT